MHFRPLGTFLIFSKKLASWKTTPPRISHNVSGDLLHVTNKVSGCDIFGRESIVSLLPSNLTDWSVGFSPDLLRILLPVFST